MVEPSALKDAYLVAGLSEAEIAQVAELATVRSYASGQSLTRNGEPATELFVILSGKLSVTSDDGDLLGEVGANNVVGEIGLVDASPRTANVTCVGPVSVAAFSTVELRKLMIQNRHWGFLMLANICRVMASRLRQTNARIDELTDKAAEPWNLAIG